MNVREQSAQSPRRPVLLASLAAGIVATVGVGIAALNVNAERKSGMRPDAILGFGEEFSWWLAAAAAAFVYALAGAYLVRVRAAAENPIIRASCLVAACALGVICPLAVGAAIDATRARQSGFVFILPAPLLLWSPWVLGCAAIIINATVDRSRKAEFGRDTNAS